MFQCGGVTSQVWQNVCDMCGKMYETCVQAGSQTGADGRMQKGWGVGETSVCTPPTCVLALRLHSNTVTVTVTVTLAFPDA
eukprot:363202-Chlamydomonas_euryale.AAC.6